MRGLSPAVQSEDPGTAGGVTQTATAQPEPLLSGPAPALWAGAGAVLVIFIIGMMLIIRGRVTPAKSLKKQAESRSFFEPAGEGAEITFDENDAPQPEPAAAKADGKKKKERWRDSAVSETEVVIDRDHENGSLHEDAADPHEEPNAAAPPAAHADRKKKPAFAGLFGKKSKPEAQPEPELSAAPDDDAFYAAEEEEAGLGFFAPAPQERASEVADEDAPAAFSPADAERLSRAEEAARSALKRAEDAEALASELRRANEDARVSLQRQEAVLDERAEALAEMERRLSAMSEELQDRIEAAAAAAEEAPLAAFHEGPAGVSEEHFAEFANLLGERFDVLRGEVNSAVEKLSRRFDLMPSAPGAATATAARVQLADLLADALAPQRYKLAFKLSSGRTAEAAILMPGPIAPVAVDARFPVEAFDAWQLSRNAGTETELRRAVLRNIADAGEKLIVADETADCAMMFIPSENILSELHAHFSDLVQESYRARVFMVSPTSLMATLHTISAVLSGAGVRETSALSFLDELHALRSRVAALETLRQNGAAHAPAKQEKPAEKQSPAARAPVQYSTVFDAPPRKVAEDGDDKSPFPLR